MRLALAALCIWGCADPSGADPNPGDVVEDTDTTAIGDDDTDITDTDSDSDTGPCLQEIPNPGGDPAPLNWTAPPGNVSPGQAYPMGVVNTDDDAPTYIGTTLPDGADAAYWVFRTGPDAVIFQIHVQNSTNPFDSMHLHDGEDLCFGDEISPLSTEIEPHHIDARYVLDPEHVYVLEVTVPLGGWF